MSVAFDYDASAVLVLAVLHVTAHSFRTSVTIHIRSTTERPADAVSYTHLTLPTNREV